MASVPDDTKLVFILMALKHSEMKMDWKAIAAEAGITLPNNAQRKFRDYAKTAGYDLINGNQVVALDGAVPITPAKKRKTPTKKGKAGKEEPNGDTNNGDASEEATSKSPTKKAKKSQPVSGAAVNRAENVDKHEAEGEDEA